MSVAQTPGGGLQLPQPGYFTGCNIHATATSRVTTYAPTTLLKGHILQMDPHNHEDRLGEQALGTPTTDFLTPLVVVTNVPVTTNESKTHSTAPTSRKDGVVEFVPVSRKVKALVTGSCTAGKTRLAIAANSCVLIPFVTGGTAAELEGGPDDEMSPVAVALENNSGGPNLIDVCFTGGLSGTI